MNILFKKLLLFFLILRGVSAEAQTIDIQKIHPLNWWVGMKNPNVQLLIYGKNIASSAVSLKPYNGVTLKKVTKVENPNYLFVDLNISKGAKAGDLQLIFTKNGEKSIKKYALKNRSAKPQGLNQSDLTYLIMPDRFANGDPSNDHFNNMRDTTCDRSAHSLRHGGDLKGIIDHLDYIKDLGATSIWLTPVIENDMPFVKSDGRVYSSYHGYAFTDHYQVDARFGGNEKYSEFVKAAHAKGLKVVQDGVYNHCGSSHWFFNDLPMKDWIHQWGTYTGTNYKNQTIIDPYASAKEKKLMVDGWFVPSMPDLNQKNPYMATYLIQNSIWVTEYFGIDAWRVDTYMYCDLEFMNRCNQALMDEFPGIFIFGEAWASTVPNQAYFVRNTMNLPFKSNQPSCCDFQMQSAFRNALTQPYSWDGGVNNLYHTLSQDFLYKKPEDLVLFLDNHDIDRFLTTVQEDVPKFKMATTWLLTMRGIPEVYYGTEILMKNSKARSDGDIREDFKGGWADDAVNKFTAAGRTATENDFFNFFKKLAQYRKSSPAITKGKMLQFTPHDGIYTYFRYTDKQRIMVISNTNNKETEVKTAHYDEILKGSKMAKNVLTDETLNDISTIKIPANTSWVLEIL